MQKLLTYCLTTCLCLYMLGACSSGKENIPEPQPKPEADRISQIPTTITLGASKEISSLSFETNCSWTATSSESWCSLSPSNGKAGTATLTITCTANPYTKERTAIISIKAGTVAATTTVKQACEIIEDSDIEDMPNEDWNS